MSPSYALQWQWRLCIDLRMLNVWNNGCRVGAPWTNSAYVYIGIAWIRVIGVRCSIIKVVVIWFSSCAVPTHCNDNDGSVVILADWMYATGVVLALDKQLVRSYCCVCTWIGRCYVLAIDAIWSCNLTLVHTSYTTITMTGLHRSSCMQCISFWPWANSAYVYNAWIYVLLVFDAVISPSWALMRSLNIWNGCRIGLLNK